MSLFYVSDTYDNSANVIYIRESLSDLFFKKGNVEIVVDVHRAGIYLKVENEYEKIAREEVYDKICDVIAVGYKYEFFTKKLQLEKMQKVHKELLLSSIISADMDEDKRYIKNKLYSIKNNCSIDGFYNFRLRNLKSKWSEIAEYIPAYFSERELKDFIMYLIDEKRGRKVFIEGGCVYDGRFNRLKRASLLPGDSLKIVKEVLISGACEVELKGKLSNEDEMYLKEYFGDKICFKA